MDFLPLNSNQLEPKNFESKLERHFGALYYCHGLKGSPGAAPCQCDRLFQTGLGSKNVLTGCLGF